MKIWIKLIIALIAGIALGMFLSTENPETLAMLEFFYDLLINIGSYVLLPIIFFSLAIGIFEMRKDKITLRLATRTIVYMLIITVFVAVLAAAIVVLFQTDRIQILNLSGETPPELSYKTILMSLFPDNSLTLFTSKGVLLAPILLFALLLGMQFNFDSVSARPVVQFFDSMSRILYNLNKYLVEFISIAMIPITAYQVLQLRMTPELDLFTPFLILTGTATGCILFIIYPLIIFLTSDRENPFRWLYGNLAPLLTTFFSGNIYFSFGSWMRHSKENDGIPRRIGAATFPFLMLFARAGTTLVTSVSFILILKSYSSLGLTFSSIAWISSVSFLLSMVTGFMPGIGVAISLPIICQLYGHGLESGAYMLQPIMPILISLSALLDMATASMLSLIITRHEGLQDSPELRNYI